MPVYDSTTGNPIYNTATGLPALDCVCCGGSTTTPPGGCSNLGNCQCCLGWHVTIQFSGVGSLCSLGTLLDGSTINEPLYDLWSTNAVGGSQICKYAVLGIAEGDTYTYSASDCTGTLLSHTTGGYNVELLNTPSGYTLSVSGPGGTVFSGGFSLPSLTAVPGTTFTVTNTLASGGSAVVTAKECGTDDCITCCDNIRFQVSGSGGSGCFPIDITLTRSGCIWSGTSGTWTGDLRFMTDLNCWRLTLTSSAGCPQLVARSGVVYTNGCPSLSAALWAFCTPPDGYAVSMSSVSCAPAPICPTDCSGCQSCFVMVVSSDSDPYGINGTYTFTIEVDSCNWTDGTNDLTCNEGVWSMTFRPSVPASLVIVFTAPVDDSGCPPVNNDTTWAFASCTPGEGATCPDPDPTYALGFESCP